jgi:hypothetical protein
MISTVTTVTVATLAAGVTLGAMSTVLLILLLASKEMVTADTRQALRVFGRTLTIGILPLLISFTLIVSFRVLEVL